MKKLVFVLLLLFSVINFAQITAVTTSGQYDSEIFDLNTASPAAGIPVIFCFTVPTTFDGDSVTIYTYPTNSNKALFFKGTYDGESLRMAVVPGQILFYHHRNFIIYKDIVT